MLLSGGLDSAVTLAAAISLADVDDANLTQAQVWITGFRASADGAALVLLGIGLSASNPRRASNWNLLVALLSFIIYYNLINRSYRISKSNNTNQCF